MYMQAQLLIDLHQTLKQQGNLVSLDATVLRSERLAAQLKTFLGADPLKIAAAAVSDLDASGNFTVSGTVAWMRLGKVQVQLTFFSSYDSNESPQEAVACLVSPVNAVSSWNMAQDYPDMPGYVDYSPGKFTSGLQASFLKDIDFQNVKFVFSSYNFATLAESLESSPGSRSTSLDKQQQQLGEMPLSAGVNFTAVVATDASIWNTVKQIKRNLGSLQLIAHISQQQDGLMLSASHVFSDGSFSLTDSITLGLKRLSLQSGLSAGTLSLPGFAITAQIGQDPAFDVTLALNIGSNLLSIEGSPDDGHVVTLDRMERMLGLKDAKLAQYLPTNTSESTFGNLGLRNLRFALSLSPVQVRSIEFSITAEKPWRIIGDKITVTPLFRWAMNNPFASAPERNTTLEIVGLWTLGTTTIYLYASLLSGDISARMAAEQTLDVAELFKTLIPGIDIPSIVLLDLGLDANYLAKTYSVALEAGGNWELSLGSETLSIEEVGLWANYDGQSITDWRMSGRVRLAQVDFQVDAEYDRALGWFVRGSIVPEEVLTLGILFHRLVADFESLTNVAVPVNIPDTYLNIAVSGMAIEYQSQQQALTVYVDLVGPIHVTDGFSLDRLAAQFKFNPSGLSAGSVALQLNLGGVTFTLQSSKAEGATGWSYQGGTGPGQQIKIGALVTDIGASFTSFAVPAPIASLLISDLTVTFNTDSQNFLFTASCAAKFKVENQQVDITVTINITKNSAGGYDKRFGGLIHIGGLQFKLFFDQDTTNTSFFATYSHTAAAKRQNIHALVAAVSQDIAKYVPESLEIDLQDVLLLYHKKDASSATYLFALDIDISAVPPLTGLPLVGKLLPKDQSVELQNLRVLVASRTVTLDLLTIFNNQLPDGIVKLPAEAPLGQGPSASAVLSFGGVPRTLAVPMGGGAAIAPPAPLPTTPPPAVTSSDTAKWLTVQKSFGPVYLNRVGVEFQKGALLFLIDAALTVAGLTLSLDGLGFGSSLNAFKPEFTLHGLGIDYKSGPLEITGAFLASTLVYKGKAYPAYSGKALLRTATFTLGAIGSYVQLDEGPSLFVYAVLNYPLGGPAFFFVTGLAAGFGYNRRLIAPAIEQVESFPLVSEAAGTTKPAALADELQRLEAFLPPSVGDYFLAVGVRFSSFKMIDSFVLLTVAFGHRFELNILGISTMILPAAGSDTKDLTPIAEIQLALRATFAPDDGFFGIQAQLTPNSFLLSRACHLTGGFAFFSWFDKANAGDFVLSVGGYHPSFTRPPHYPVVPRLGFNWRVNDNLTLKGAAYYALTPSMLMAGASLNATWEDGSLKAWFDAAMDFLIAWKPYHYEASFHISVGASYTFDAFGTHTINAHVGADVRMWGPEFSGVAHIDLSVVSFTIRFGADKQPALKAIDWRQFRASFLPDAAKICTVVVRSGLARAAQSADSPGGAQDNLGVVSPAELVLTTDSVIPSKGARRGPAALNNQPAVDAPLVTDDAALVFGVGPLGLGKGAEVFSSQQRIEITYGAKNERADDRFSFHPLTKSAPFALWGDQLRPSVNQPQLVEKLLAGYEIRPLPPHEPASPQPWLARSALQSATPVASEADAFDWAQPTAFVGVLPADPAARELAIRGSIGAATKRANIAAMLRGAALDLGDFDDYDFLEIPQVAAHLA